jgi:hypothetical protein
MSRGLSRLEHGADEHISLLLLLLFEPGRLDWFGISDLKPLAIEGVDEPIPQLWRL